ncbi:MAG: hypothetical protein HPY65_00840 [Syntrophaceae bacterium]|nr:hypothetical protein [Syntrophaceae bacterium]
MAEDLLDQWVKLITPIFPTNAWIASRYADNDYVIQVDWKLESDPMRPDKRSKKIQIIIREKVIDNYLDKNRQDRDLDNDTLKQSVCERYNMFHPEDDTVSTTYTRTETWLFSKSFINEYKY